MTTALQLNAANSILNGQGLAVNANLLTTITSFQSLQTVRYVSSIFANIATGNTVNSGIGANLYPILNSLGTGLYYGKWLLDFYDNNTLAKPEPTLNSGVYYNYGNNIVTSSLSNNLKNQAQFPLTNGVSGFANGFITCSGTISTALEVIGGAKVFSNKTYAQSGINFTGPMHLATNGIGTNGGLLASVVGNWGTMYDIKNIANFGDPYVFGQNLINQGLGTYGGWITQLSAVGLNTSNLTAGPIAKTTTTTTPTVTVQQTEIGQINLPSFATATTTTTSAGASATVVHSIYQTVTGANLSAIVSATGITTNTQLTTLDDYLNLNKVVSPDLVTKLGQLGVVDFPTLGAYLNQLVGKGNFSSWSSMASFFNSIVVPNFATGQKTTGANTLISSSVASSLTSSYGSLGTGQGPFGNPILLDYLGAISGIGYVSNLQTLISCYRSIAPTTVESALATLSTAVSAYITAFITSGTASTSSVSSATTGVATAISALGNTPTMTVATAAHISIINKINTEVQNIFAAGATFTAGSPRLLTSFAQSIVGYASDTTTANGKQIFDQIISNDSAGDTIRAAVAESLNSAILSSVGINTNNDFSATSAIVQANAQNIPLSTYLQQNQ